MTKVGSQVLKFRHSLFYFPLGWRKLVRTPHYIQAMPLGGVNWRDNCAITCALSHALRNAKVKGSHCLPGVPEPHP
jgi:hypothetical protein